MYHLIDYYERVNPKAQDCRRGEFWWSCIPYVPTTRLVKRVYESGATANLDIGTLAREGLDQGATPTAQTFWAVTHYKMRSVVVLSTPGEEYHERSWHGGDHYLVAPVYSLRDPLSGEYRVRADFVWAVITYQFRSLFYLPHDSAGGTHEAVVHLDRSMALHKSWLLRPRGIRLTKDARACLDRWLACFICGRVPRTFNRDLEDYRQMMGTDPAVRYEVFGAGTN